MTGETLERVDTADGAVYECFVCGGQSSTRLPDHDDGCLVMREGKDATVYERDAVIERVHEVTARVRFKDTGSLSYVVHDHVEVLD